MLIGRRIFQQIEKNIGNTNNIPRHDTNQSMGQFIGKLAQLQHIGVGI